MRLNLMPNSITPIVRNLILLNIFVFILQFIIPNISDFIAMHYPTNPKFKPFQLISHMFAHGGLLHIVFNMYALYSFGVILEQQLHQKKFATLYLGSGIGAIAFHLLINGIVAYKNVGTLLLTESMALSNTTLYDVYTPSLLGASGAIYGLLAGFGILFPNAPLVLLFIPVPIKAKYMIPLLILIYDIGFAQYKLDSVAHYAHIGGAIVGAILTLYWKRNWFKPI